MRLIFEVIRSVQPFELPGLHLVLAVVVVTPMLVAPPLAKSLDQVGVIRAAARVPLGAFLTSQVLHLFLDLEAAVQGDADLHATEDLVAVAAEALDFVAVTPRSDGVHAVLVDAS